MDGVVGSGELQVVGEEEFRGHSGHAVTAPSNQMGERPTGLANNR